MSELPSSSAALEAKDVMVQFGGLTALDGVDITVPPESVIGLVGPNGAGKSTMFAVCSGLLRPNRGRVYLRGRDITNSTPQARAHLGLARTFQQPEMFFGLTVRQHLVLAYRVRRHRRRLWRDMFDLGGFRPARKDETERVDMLLELLSLDRIADALVDSLPLGTTRLVEVGRALASDPDVVLLDEPMSGLDQHEAARLATALQRTVKDGGPSLLLVEHDVDMVLKMCSNIYVLDFGQLIAMGPPDTIRTDPAVKAAYLGNAPIDDGQAHPPLPSRPLV